MRNGGLVFGSSCHLNCTRSAPDTGSCSTVRRAGSPGPDSAGSGSCRAAQPRLERRPREFGPRAAQQRLRPGPAPPPARLPWRSTGCTRRLVTVSHRAMISSLSSRPSRFRQPSVSKWLSPDISPPEKGAEGDAAKVALSARGRAGALATDTGSVFSVALPGTVSDIPVPVPGGWGGVLPQKVLEETLGIPTYGSGLPGSSIPPIALKRGIVTIHLPLAGWLETNL